MVVEKKKKEKKQKKAEERERDKIPFRINNKIDTRIAYSKKIESFCCQHH